MKNTLRKKKRAFIRESAEYRNYLKAHGIRVVWEYMPPLDFNKRDTEPPTDGVPRMRYAEDDKVIRFLKRKYGKGGYQKVFCFDDVKDCIGWMDSL